MKTIIDLFLHLDKHLESAVNTMGVWVYVLIFAIIFMETGFVITPFLPGDSLLFAAGAIASLSELNIFTLYIIILIAAIFGDSVNYWIGNKIGPKAFEKDSRFIKKKYLLQAQAFYEKHGGKAITLSRFVPIVRTFAPFVAGIASMHYGNFLKNNILGGFLWVTLFLWGGYFFGNIPFVKEHFHYIVIAIVLISFIPVAIEFIKSRKK